MGEYTIVPEDLMDSAYGENVQRFLRRQKSTGGGSWGSSTAMVGGSGLVCELLRAGAPSGSLELRVASPACSLRLEVWLMPRLALSLNLRHTSTDKLIRMLTPEPLFCIDGLFS